jgi:tetraacyldisaccharide 4'-kinase
MNRDHLTSLYFLGRPFSPLYSYAMKLRALLYQKQILASHFFDVPVISVGNLTMGGTGKTPMVIYLARFLAEEGFKVGIVSRGYRGEAKGPVNIVSDGAELLMSAQQAGDEPVLLASRLKETVVAVGRNRHLAVDEVIRSFQCDAILLDDGFQHLKMRRDIDFVLFDVDHFAGTSRVFPGGELREPLTALHRCDAFVLTGVSEHNSERAGKCETLLQERFADKPVFWLSPTYTQFLHYVIFPSSIKKSVVALPDIPRNLFGFSGIAQADRFYKMVEQQGIILKGTKTYRDHHYYQPEDIKDLLWLASKAGTSGFITTEKDMVKLSYPHQAPVPFYVPILEYARNESLESFITAKISQTKPAA